MIERRWQVTEFFYVAAEVVAWFMLIRVMATISEGNYWRDLRLDLESAIRSGDLADPEAAQALLPALHAAADGASGPSLLAMVLTAFGAFYFARWLATWNLDGALGAIVLILGSFLALNVLVRLGLGGSWQIWDFSGVGAFMEQREALVTSSDDLDGFVADPYLGVQHTGTVALSVAFMTFTWVRFIIASRGEMSFERVLRSTSIGFVAVLIALLVGGLADVPAVARYALVHFILVVLVLAVANHARAALPSEATQRVGPWVVSVGGTVAVLTVIALVIGLLAYVNAGVVLTMVGTIALRIIEFLLLVILTPLYWAISSIFEFFFPDGIPGLQQDGPPEGEQNGDDDPTAERSLPDWLGNVLRFISVGVLALGIYYLARLLLSRRRRGDGEIEPVRSQGSGGAGLGQLLRDLFPRGRRNDPGRWMDRHPIYRLYSRVVNDSHDRGFRSLPGETPIEFSDRAGHALTAPFERVGRAFDRARYGRHYPSEDDVRRMQAEVAQWEQATPATPELRERMAGAAPMSEERQIELRIQRQRYLLRGDIERARRIDIEDTRG